MTNTETCHKQRAVVMMAEEKQMTKVIAIFRQRGQKALEFARQTVKQEEVTYKPLQEALHYFMESWEDVLHPALVSLACEAVGGNPDATTQLSAAIVLLAGGADVHDDIIDQSVTKSSKPTVFGKFGKDIAILAGDALLLQGTYVLHEACEALPQSQRQEILEIIKHAFFEVSGAEAEEAGFRGRLDLSGQEYLEIIRGKVAAGEASTRIGAIVGGGTAEEVKTLGHYGRTFGVLMTIRDEFIDMFELEELKNRAERECLPLPILLTFKDEAKKAEILQLLKEELTEDTIDRILDLVLDSKETRDLKEKLEYLIHEERQNIAVVKNCRGCLESIAEATLEDM
jgi:geranylgeranyl diphosphate synthase type I